MRLQTWLVSIAGLKILAGVLAVSLGAVSLLGQSTSGIPAWTYMAQIVAFAAAGALLWMGGKNDARARDLATFYILAASVFSSPFIRRAGLDQLPPLSSISMLLAAINVDAFIPFALWRFANRFPRYVILGPWEPLARWMQHVAWGFGILFLALGIATGASDLLGATRFGLRHPFVRLLYWSLEFLAILSALIFIRWKSRRTTLAEQRRGKLFIAGLLFGMTPIALDTILDILVPPYTRLMTDPRMVRAVGFLVLPALLSVPFTTSYAVLVHKALDVRLVIRRAMQYALARYTLLAIVGAPFVFMTVQVLLNRHRPLTEAVGGSAPLGLATVLLGFVAYRARQPLLRSLDRRFYREEYDARAILSHLVERIRETRSAGQLADLIRTEITRALHVTSSAVLFLDDTSHRFVDPVARYPSLPQGSDLVVLTGRRLTLSVNAIKSQGTWRALSSEDRSWLANGGFELLVVIRGSDSVRPLGIIALGEKRSELPYTKADIELILDVAASASLVLEHRFLTEIPSDRTSRLGSGMATATPARECSSCGFFDASGSEACPRCDSKTVAAFLPSELYGKFIVEGRIGEGAMGVVYRARDTMLHRTVAIKTLPQVSPEHTYRLRREARTMASIQHPHLAIIYDMESWEGTPLMIMEYLGGGTLKRRIASGPMPLDFAVEIALTISATLVRTHRAGILHRDLKPSNIGFDSEGSVKILDFGIAHILPLISVPQASLEAPRSTAKALSSTTISLAATTPSVQSDSESMYAIGTPLYMSPEALSHHRPHPSFDTWSLAIVLYEMIAGRHPLLLPGEELRFEDLSSPRIPELRSLRSDCPPRLAEFVHRALSRDRSERPQTAAAFHRRLSDASEVQPAG